MSIVTKRLAEIENELYRLRIRCTDLEIDRDRLIRKVRQLSENSTSLEPSKQVTMKHTPEGIYIECQ